MVLSPMAKRLDSGSVGDSIKQHALVNHSNGSLPAHLAPHKPSKLQDHRDGQMKEQAIRANATIDFAANMMHSPT